MDYLEFACEPEACAVVERWVQDHPILRFTTCISTQLLSDWVERGRPPANNSCSNCYALVMEISLDEIEVRMAAVAYRAGLCDEAVFTGLADREGGYMRKKILFYKHPKCYRMMINKSPLKTS